MSLALSVVALLLELSPKATYPEVESVLLTDIYDVAHSPLVAGAAFDSILAFFAALVEADMEVATHVVPNLAIAVEKAPKAEASQGNVARCIGQVVKAQRGVAAGTVAEFSKHLKVSKCTVRRSNSHPFHKPSSKARTSQIVLSLLVMGEVGRFMSVLTALYIFRGNSSCCAVICPCKKMSSLTSLKNLPPSKRRFGQLLPSPLVSIMFDDSCESKSDNRNR